MQEKICGGCSNFAWQGKFEMSSSHPITATGANAAGFNRIVAGVIKDGTSLRTTRKPRLQKFKTQS